MFERITMVEYLEKEKGRGWWGSESMATYYENLETSDNPFNWIQIVPLMSPEIQQKMGFDHAGFLETSLMLAAIPERVNMDLLKDDGLWFTKDAYKASSEYGKKVYKMMVGYLIEIAK